MGLLNILLPFARTNVCLDYVLLVNRFIDDDVVTCPSVLTSYVNFCFDVCCQLEMFFLRLDRFCSPLLNCLSCQKGAAFKVRKREEVQAQSAEIRIEVIWLDVLYTFPLLDFAGSKDIWRVSQRFLGRKRQLTCSGVGQTKFTPSLRCKSTGRTFYLPVSVKVTSRYHTFRTMIVGNTLRTMKFGKSCSPDRFSSSCS